MELELPSPKWLPLFEKNRPPIILVNGAEAEGAFDSKRRIINPATGMLIPEHRIIDRGHKRTRYYVAFGGRAGSKSWTFALAAILRAMEEKMTVLCCRQIQSTIADSVLSVLENRIKDLGLDCEFNVLTNAIRHNKTGTDFVFRGLKHNMKEIKSLEGTKVCWIEEAVDLAEETFDELDPTIRVKDAEIWIGFNTGTVDDYVYKRFILTPDPDVTLINVNYIDNVMVDESSVTLAEKMKAMDYDKYLNIWMGQPRIAKEGGVFTTKNVSYVDVLPIGGRFVRAWDMASTAYDEKKGNDPDYTVGALLHVDYEGRYTICDIVRFRGRPEEVENTLVATATRDGLGVLQSLPIDPGAAGKFMAQHLTRKLAGFRISSSPESGDKVTRAEPFASQVNAGNVKMVRAKWNEELIKELEGFPNTTHDDQCLIAGTMIHTLRGKVEIENLTCDDKVLTPDGYKEIIACGFTGIKKVISFKTIAGTSNHPIFTVDKGYISLDTLTCANTTIGASLCDWIKIALLKSLSSTEENSKGWEDVVYIIYQQQQQIKEGKILKAYMLLFGNFILDRQFKKVMRFTIKTAIHLITSLKIWSVYQLVNIAHSLKISTWNKIKSILSAYARWLPCGINQMLAGNGINSTQLKLQKQHLLSENIHALSAVKNSQQKNPALLNTVASYAEKEEDKKLTQEKKSTNLHAKYAEKNHSEIRKHEDSVHMLVQEKEQVPVYNLSVKDANCYFANDILVHNCDALSRCFMELQKNHILQFARITGL